MICVFCVGRLGHTRIGPAVSFSRTCLIWYISSTESTHTHVNTHTLPAAVQTQTQGRTAEKCPVRIKTNGSGVQFRLIGYWWVVKTRSGGRTGAAASDGRSTLDLLLCFSSGRPHLCHSVARRPQTDSPDPGAFWNARWEPARSVWAAERSWWRWPVPGWWLWRSQRWGCLDRHQAERRWGPRGTVGMALRCSGEVMGGWAVELDL